jgi:hypothetical protein
MPSRPDPAAPRRADVATPFARCALSALVAAALLAGCASPSQSVYFFTKTSTAIVEADAMPASLSIGYDRMEGYAGPRFADGTVFPVASSIESNGRTIDREVRQVFAAGRAARIATLPDDAQPPGGERRTAAAAARATPGAAAPAATSGTSGTSASAAGAAAADPPTRVMFYATGTSIGVKVGFTEGAPLPTSFNLGYKRKEVAVIPVSAGQTDTSALGSFSNGVNAPAPAGAGRAEIGFDVQQYFATGDAADHLARLPAIRARFSENAAQAIGGDIERFRQQEARQGRLALDAIACVHRLDEPRLARAWNNMEDLQLFAHRAPVPGIRAQATAAGQRQKYLEAMQLLDPDKPEATRTLELHKAAVCRLADGQGVRP